MSRQSSNQYDAQGRLINGFDYDNQCWVINGIVQKCGHRDACDCYGKAHAGEQAKAPVKS